MPTFSQQVSGILPTNLEFTNILDLGVKWYALVWSQYDTFHDTMFHNTFHNIQCDTKWHHMATEIWVNIGSGDDFSPGQRGPL